MNSDEKLLSESKMFYPDVADMENVSEEILHSLTMTWSDRWHIFFFQVPVNNLFVFLNQTL